VDELADSTSLLNDQDGSCRRLADDGYLFFRGLLPAAEVRAVGSAAAGQPGRDTSAGAQAGDEGPLHV
jgi:hypothetical protein